MWPPPAVLGCGHTSDGVGFWHRSRMQTWGWGRTMSRRSATAKTDTFSIQDKSHPGSCCCQQQIPPFRWWGILSPLCQPPWAPQEAGEQAKRQNFSFTISFMIISFPQHQLLVVLVRKMWPTLILTDFCELCKCLREKWNSQEALKRAGWHGLGNGRNAHLFSVCDTTADGNRSITQQICSDIILYLKETLNQRPIFLSIVE